MIRKFFSEQLARQLAAEGKQADLIVGNNVYAHVPDINDFTRGLKAALKPGGAITLEFPHLMRVLERTQFDTVYHEHFSYLSLHTVARIFTAPACASSMSRSLRPMAAACGFTAAMLRTLVRYPPRSLR